MAATYTARQVAREASTASRTFSDKQVRDFARDTMARFDKSKHPERLPHAYTAAERTALVAGLRKRAGIAVAKPRKATPVAKPVATVAKP